MLLMTAGTRRICPEKATCLSRCFQLSSPSWAIPLLGDDPQNQPGSIKAHSTPQKTCVVPDDDLMSSRSSRNLEFRPLNYVFSMSKPSGDSQPQFIFKSLSSVPGPHQEDLSFSQPHSSSKFTLDSMWGNHSDRPSRHFQWNREKAKNELSGELILAGNTVGGALYYTEPSITCSHWECGLWVWGDPFLPAQLSGILEAGGLCRQIKGKPIVRFWPDITGLPLEYEVQEVYMMSPFVIHGGGRWGFPRLCEGRNICLCWRGQ